MPRMVVIAGPPGGGKSTAFPAGTFEVEFFNADDRAAMLNAGSYRAITPAVRAQVNGLFEAFVNENIRAKKSFAFETTLRTDITLRQAADAQRSGFTVTMKYLAMGSLQDHLRRVAARAEGGGHAASSNTLGRIYDASLRNLSASIRALDDVEVFDNAAFGKRPRLVLESLRGRLGPIRGHPPASPEFWQDAASMALIEVVIVNCVISPQGGKGPYAKHGVFPRSHEKLAQDRNLRD